MSRERLAQAFDKAAEAMVELALEIRASDTPSREAAVPDAPAASAAGSAAPPQPAPSAPYNHNECPKHHVPFEPGTYGPFCKQPTDDPAWGKVKGDRMWCRITPKNAPEYIRLLAA